MTQRIEVGPGTYPVRNVTTGIVANVVVPGLTVAVAQTTPSVGQTLSLTSNAAAGASFQWRRGATDIAGATSASYVAQAADAGQSVSCRVTSGVQSVTSAAVPVAAAAAGTFSATFTAFASDEAEFVPNKTFNGVAIGSADSSRRLYVYMFTNGNETSPVSLSVNAGAAVSPIASIRPAGQRQVLVFQADVPTGTTANFQFTNAAGSLLSTGMAVIRVVGNHTVATATAEGGSTAIPVSIATVAGDRVFVGVMSRFNAGASHYTPPSGFTEHVDAPIRPSVPALPVTIVGGTAAGASPETFTTTPGAFQEYAALALRVRAA